MIVEIYNMIGGKPMLIKPNFLDHYTFGTTGKITTINDVSIKSGSVSKVIIYDSIENVTVDIENKAYIVKGQGTEVEFDCENPIEKLYEVLREKMIEDAGYLNDLK